MARQRLYGRLGAAVVGVPVLVAGVALAAPAYADEATYVNDMHNAGIASADGDSGLLSTGKQVCDLIHSGTSPADVKAKLVYNSNSSQGSSGITADQANAIVNYAMVDLCPSA